jgi:hypothetical protein
MKVIEDWMTEEDELFWEDEIELRRRGQVWVDVGCGRWVRIG